MHLQNLSMKKQKLSELNLEKLRNTESFFFRLTNPYPYLDSS